MLLLVAVLGQEEHEESLASWDVGSKEW